VPHRGAAAPNGQADVALQTYRTKRNFAVTPEPRGVKAKKAGYQYVIQKHAATRLHYDLRLELDGVMKSWAVTRGPSLVPGEKRLAVQVEDHPVEYNKFEGTIPKGQYGGGTVMIWDRGRWSPEGDPHYGLEKGHLSFTLDGDKLKGGWHLVRIRSRPGDMKPNWLLIKAHDDAQRSESDPDILEEMPNSVASGRSMPEIAEGKGAKRVWQSNRSVEENVKGGATKTVRTRSAAAASRPVNSARAPRRPAEARKAKSKAKSKAKAKTKSKRSDPGLAPLPDFLPPSLASLRTAPPPGPGWVHEIKFDGYRIQARLEHGDVRLLTRKGLDWVAKFPDVAEAVGKLRADTALIDGEIVVEDENGISSFSALQAALKDGNRDGFVYYIFDLLHLDGRDLTGLPLIERKVALQRLLQRSKAGDAIRYSEHFEEDGALMLKHACKMHLEGIVSKRRDAPYRSGRLDTFIKAKCSNAQELVIGGYAPSTAMPKAIGGLIAGYYENDRLIYAGHVGTGYSQAMAKDLWKRLHPLEVATPPFDAMSPEERRRKDMRWVKPTMVIEANFRGWTADRLVRQASFKGIREDKPAKEVVRELPTMIDNGADSPRAKAAAARSATTAKKTAPAPKKRSAKSAAAKGASKPRANGDIRFTHPDRVYWADVGVTKQNLADYYRMAWKWMAPHVVDRPLSFLRCPDGTAGQCFFQKHASAGITAERLRTVIDSNKRQIIAVEDLDGVLSLVQAGVLEIHVRGSRMDRLDLCDRVVFDLDPGDGVGWADIVAAARDVRERLASIDLEAFVKVSGGKGVHVVLPIEGTDWDTTKTFAQALAMTMAADSPKRYAAKITKSERTGRIFIDYLRNSLEQTSVAAYSTRTRAGAPVSVPLAWEELGRLRAANDYTVLNLGKRLGGLKQDPWKDMARIRQKLPDLAGLRRRGAKAKK
jgi:bifunctional non-homologous end joining protein LigD